LLTDEKEKHPMRMDRKKEDKKTRVHENRKGKYMPLPMKKKGKTMGKKKAS
jgi:hypothetical protein